MSHTHELLHTLAEVHGIQCSYQGHDGLHHDIQDSTLAAVLAALGTVVDVNSESELKQALLMKEEEQWRNGLQPTTVLQAGTSSDVHVHIPHGSAVRVHVRLEDGTEMPLDQVEDHTAPREIDQILLGRASFRLPGNLPAGYHQLTAYCADEQRLHSELIITPVRLTTGDVFERRRGWGLSAQLYSVRSRSSWGVGDLGDLSTLLSLTHQHGGDFVLVNPLHASEPTPPVMDSPYSPVTRQFLNPLYLRIEDIPEYEMVTQDERHFIDQLAQEFQTTNLDPVALDRNASYEAKLEALKLLYQVPMTVARKEQYDRYLSDIGAAVDKFALWCARRSNQGEDQHDFYRWLQFLCDEQLGKAQESAHRVGMRVGVMIDLAVGADRHTADAWMLGKNLVESMSVGAPPDMYNQLGQDWSQHPWNPAYLEATGYRAYRDMLRNVLRHAGAIRIDHILGLFRLWWVPAEAGPQSGAYVRYNHEAMIGILVLEAQRAGTVVIGEDLGTFEPWVQDYLAARGLLGTSILWFEQSDGTPRPPEHYRQRCLASLNTHDLPPTVGFLQGIHLKLREDLGLLTVDGQQEHKKFRTEVERFLQAASDDGFLSPEHTSLQHLHTDADFATVVRALTLYLGQAPSLLHSIALVDAVGERRIQNQPGTTQDQYPNWSIPLADESGQVILLDDLAAHDGFTDLLGAVNDSFRVVV